MSQYDYKEFKVIYDISYSKQLNLYEAHGSVHLNKKNIPAFSQEFSTEDSSPLGAEKGIKRLMEQYIDFEWVQFEKLKYVNW